MLGNNMLEMPLKTKSLGTENISGLFAAVVIEIRANIHYFDLIRLDKLFFFRTKRNFRTCTSNHLGNPSSQSNKYYRGTERAHRPSHSCCLMLSA
jgi:hypothetical protein